MGTSMNQKTIIPLKSSMIDCCRYLDDLMCINNNQLMDTVMTEIYPKKLVLTSDGAVSQCHYLDLDLEIRNGKIHSKLYDKGDAFGLIVLIWQYTCERKLQRFCFS